jgi:predicted urease superfamily metal-dependent hydrolase
MPELAFWHEPQVPNLAAAEARFQRILGDDDPVPLSGLEQRLQDFVNLAEQDAPQAEIVAIGQAGGEPLYSRSGIVVRFPEEITKQVHPKLGSAAVQLGLHTYDRDGQFVFGVSKDPDISARSS